MNSQGDVAGQRGHFDGEYTFGDHLSGPYANDAHAKHALERGAEDAVTPRMRRTAFLCVMGVRWRAGLAR